MRYTRNLKDRGKALLMAVIMLFSTIAPCISDLGIITKVFAETQSVGDVPTGFPTKLDNKTIDIGTDTHNNINYGNGIGIVDGNRYGYDYKSCEYLINYSVGESKEKYDDLMAVTIGNVDTSYACSSLTAHDNTTTTSGTNTWFTIALNKDLYGLGISEVYLHCDDPGLPYPTGLTLTITPLGRVTNEYTDDAGDTVKTVVVYYKMYGVTTVSGTQNGILYMSMAAYYKEENSGKLKLKKSSSNTNLTDNNTNGCYSLAGAKYSIFESESDARNSVLSCLNPKGTRITTGAVATLTTDENGDSNVLTKDDGLDFTKTYYIVEIKK